MSSSTREPLSCRVRPAARADIPAIVEIYNHEVLTSTSTFDTEPTTVTARNAWLESRAASRHPVLVAQLGARVAGFSATSPWSERKAYARTAESSVYVHRELRGQGVGRALLTALIEHARAAGLGVLLARISTESGASLALHEALGFQRIGVMRRAGLKFGRLLDVVLCDLHLDLLGARDAHGGRDTEDRS